MNHLRSVHLNSFQCDQCGKSLKRSYLLKQHKKIIHQGIKVYRCIDCSKTFGQKETLRVHATMFHGGPKDFCCDYCSREFGSLYHLQRHVKTAMTTFSSEGPRRPPLGAFSVKESSENADLTQWAPFLKYYAIVPSLNILFLYLWVHLHIQFWSRYIVHTKKGALDRVGFPQLSYSTHGLCL